MARLLIAGQNQLSDALNHFLLHFGVKYIAQNNEEMNVYSRTL